MNIDNIIKTLDKFTELPIQEKWDNSGIQLFTCNEKVNKIVLSLDVSEEVIDFATKEGSNLIISHHPLIFKELKSVDYRDATGNILINAIKNRINIISYHTNIDKQTNGLADYFCEKLGIANATAMPLCKPDYEPLYKIITFIPESSLNEFLNFLDNNNLSIIGNYKACSFFQKGKGSFFPFAGSTPYEGVKEKLNIVDEIRIEFQVAGDKLRTILSELKKIHPYEEPVFDVFPLFKNGKVKGALGRVILLEKSIELRVLLKRIKSVFNVSNLKYTANKHNRLISKIAVCPGSGMSLVVDAVKNGCDVFITGDVKYHEAQFAVAKEIVVVDLGHFETEIIFTEMMKEKLEQLLNIEIITFKQKNIFNYI